MIYCISLCYTTLQYNNYRILHYNPIDTRLQTRLGGASKRLLGCGDPGSGELPGSSPSKEIDSPWLRVLGKKRSIHYA